MSRWLVERQAHIVLFAWRCGSKLIKWSHLRSIGAEKVEISYWGRLWISSKVKTGRPWSYRCCTSWTGRASRRLGFLMLSDDNDVREWRDLISWGMELLLKSGLLSSSAALPRIIFPISSRCHPVMSHFPLNLRLRIARSLDVGPSASTSTLLADDIHLPCRLRNDTSGKRDLVPSNLRGRREGAPLAFSSISQIEPGQNLLLAAERAIKIISILSF